MSSHIKLSELSLGKDGIITALNAGEASNARLTDMGFYPSAHIKPLFSALWGDPVAYRLQNAIIALRRSDAEKIAVIPI